MLGFNTAKSSHALLVRKNPIRDGVTFGEFLRRRNDDKHELEVLTRHLKSHVDF